MQTEGPDRPATDLVRVAGPHSAHLAIAVPAPTTVRICRECCGSGKASTPNYPWIISQLSSWVQVTLTLTTTKEELDRNR